MWVSSGNTAVSNDIGEPQPLQKLRRTPTDDCRTWRGPSQERPDRFTPNQLTWSADAARRQSTQWQMAAHRIEPLDLHFTAPQKHRPVNFCITQTFGDRSGASVRPEPR
jgi:hypothetical protein